MTILNFSQISELELASPADLFLAGSGYEQRATHCASKHSAFAAKRVAFAFTEHSTTPSRKRNDRTFSKLGFELLPGAGDDASVPSQYLIEAISTLDTPVPRIVIDFSSMTRTWLAGLVRDLGQLSREVEVDFAYSPATYAGPKHDRLNPVHVGPILEDDSPLQAPNAPISLVLGVGYGQDEALGVVELLDPREAFAFVTATPLDRRFEKRIADANDELFERIGHDRVIPYSLTDWTRTAFTLDSLCSRLQFESRVVVVSLGPKPFSLITLLLASVRRKIGVWRISPGAQAPPQQRVPLGPVLAARVRFGYSSDSAHRAR